MLALLHPRFLGLRLSKRLGLGCFDVVEVDLSERQRSRAAVLVLEVATDAFGMGFEVVLGLDVG